MSITYQPISWIVDNFDSWFDIYQEYEAVLASCDTVESPDDLSAADDEQLVCFVGATWCKIVAADVRHRLPAGLVALDASRPAAAELLKRLRRRRKSSAAVAYALARWHDAAGKLCYRLGDHTQAREFTRTALHLASLHKLDRCRFDISSNRIRSSIEESHPGGVRGEIDQLVTQEYRTELQDAFAALAKMNCPLALAFQQPDVPIDELHALARRAGSQERELLRGICSLLHNFSTEAVGQDESTIRLESSRQSEKIARALDDQYRLGQALHQQALQQQCQKPDLARDLWIEVRDRIQWARGKLFARQNLALLELDKTPPGQSRGDDLVERLDTLFALIDEIQLRGTDGVVSALDIDLYGWTVRHAYRVQEILRNTLNADPAAAGRIDFRKISDRMYEELSQMVRSYRSVVTVTVYKFAFGKHFTWAYDMLVNYNLNDKKQRAAFVWSEDSRSRDLLDMLATQRVGATTTTTNASVFRVDPPSSVNKPKGLLTKRSLRFEEDADGRLRSAVVNSYQRFEEFAKQNTLEPTTIDPEIYDRCREFAARTGDLILSFFVTKRHPKTNAPTHYGVFRFYDDRADVREEITIADSLAHLNSLMEFCEASQAVDLGDYRQRLEDWCRAVGEEVIAKALAGLPLRPDTAIVLIPTEQLWRLPLHVAVMADAPLAVRFPVCYSVSVTALITYGRYYRQVVDAPARSKFALLATSDEDGSLFGKETLRLLGKRLGRDLTSRARVAGPPRLWNEPALRKSKLNVGRSDLASLERCIKFRPNWLIVEGHGSYLQDRGIAHPYLSFPDEPNQVVTPYDLAMVPSMESVQLAVLAACLSGQGADLDGGEVSGFLRALIAADVGCCALSLWPVHDDDTIEFMSALVKGLADASGPLNLTRSFHSIYQATADRDNVGRSISKCCFGLYV